MEWGRGGEDRPTRRLALCLGEEDVGRDPGSCLFPRVWIRNPRNSSPQFSHKRNEGWGVGAGLSPPQRKGSANQGASASSNSPTITPGQKVKVTLP